MAKTPDGYPSQDEEIVRKTEFINRVTEELELNLKTDDPDGVALEMAASLMKVLGIDSGGAIAIEEEDGIKRYRLIDILKMEEKDGRLNAGRMSQIFGKDALKKYSDKVKKSPYFNLLQNVEGILICPTDNVGVDAYIGLKDQQGNIRVVLFLDKTDEPFDLFGYEKDFEKLMVEWGGVYEYKFKERQKEGIHFEELIKEIIDELYDTLHLETVGAPQVKKMRAELKKITDVIGQGEISDDNFTDASPVIIASPSFPSYGEKSKTEELSEVPDKTIVLSKNALLVYLRLLDFEDLDQEVADEIAKGIHKYLHTEREPFKYIVSNLEDPNKAKQIIIGLLEKYIKEKTENAVEIQKLKEEKAIDDLTGLYGKARLKKDVQEEIMRSHRENSAFGLLMLDLDHFKKVNDTQGHLVGDMVLREVAKRLKSVIRSYDTAARFGGEEFAIILPHANSGEVCLVAHRILEKIKNDPIIIDLLGEKLEIPVSVSIGVAVFQGNINEIKEESGDQDSSEDCERLFREADNNLYIVKNTGRGNVAINGYPIKRREAAILAEEEKRGPRFERRREKK